MALPALASEDPALALRRRLAASQACLAVLGPQPRGAADPVWLFLRELAAVIEGSGQAGALVATDGPWSRPNQHNTARFPRVRLEIHADPTRENGVITQRDAESRAFHVWEPFDDELHRVTGFSELWGVQEGDPGLRVWGAQRLSYPEVFSVQDWEGGARLVCYYGLNVG